MERLSRKRLRLEDKEQEEDTTSNAKDNEDETEEDDPPEYYQPNSFIACVYENGWYVGQVMEKEGEPEADEREEYVLVSFMKWTGAKGIHLKWPERKDVLNVLKVGTYGTQSGRYSTYGTVQW